MDFTFERQNAVLIVRVEGRIDGSNAQTFQHDLAGTIAEPDQAVVLDLEQLSYISSAGLRAILIVARSLEDRKAQFAVCSLSSSVQEIFQINGFDHIISVRENQADARSSFSL